MSGAGLPCVLRSTAPFTYARLHGPDHHHLYAGAYNDDDLRWWADRVREWKDMGRDVFVYFNNDGGGNAVRNALTLKWMVGAKFSLRIEQLPAAIRFLRVPFSKLVYSIHANYDAAQTLFVRERTIQSEQVENMPFAAAAPGYATRSGCRTRLAAAAPGDTANARGVRSRR